MTAVRCDVSSAQPDKTRGLQINRGRLERLAPHAATACKILCDELLAPGRKFGSLPLLASRCTFGSNVAFSAHCIKPPRTDSTGEVDQNMALLDQKATVLGRCFEQPAPQTNSESLALTQGAYTTPSNFKIRPFQKRPSTLDAPRITSRSLSIIEKLRLP